MPIVESSHGMLMRHRAAAVLLAGGLALLPFAARPAASSPPNTQAKPGDSDSAPATHATRGVVTSVDATTLAIERFAHRGEMTFQRLPTTRVEGEIVVGATVSVRYREDGARHVATAIAVQRPRLPPDSLARGRLGE